MTDTQSLKSAVELARNNGVRFPNESDEYRGARDALLAEEIELRRNVEGGRRAASRTAAGRRSDRDYSFEGENGSVSFAELFGDKKTLAVYSDMYGPERKRPCPTCTSLLSAWDGEAADPGQDSRGAPDLMPLWTILDATPEGRGTDWYPKLEYAKAPA